MSVKLSASERGILQSLQRGDKLEVIYLVSPAFARVTDKDTRQESIVIIGDVLELEKLGLAKATETADAIFEYELTATGREWREEESQNPPKPYVPPVQSESWISKYGFVVGILIGIPIAFIIGFVIAKC